MSNRQDFSTYTETDAASRATVTASAITLTILDNDESCLVYKDFTASYFAADFEHSFTLTVTAKTGTPITYIWGMANATDAMQTQIDAGTSKLLALRLESLNSISIFEGDGTNADYTTGSYEMTVGKSYFIRVCRDESVGTYGTLYVYLYQDASCSVLLETITHTLEIKTDFRYLFAFCGQCTGSGGSAWSGTISGLTLESHPYTLSNMLTTIRYYLRETSASFWSDAELTAYINRGIREIAIRSGCIQHIDAATATDETRLISYTGHKVIAVEYIPASGVARYLRNISPLMVGHVFIADEDGEPEYWFEEDGYIGIEPIPNTTYSFRFYVADEPTADLTVNTQIPEIPPAFRQAVIMYAIFLALTKDKKFSLAIFMYALYNNELAYHTADKVINVPVGMKNLRAE